ncbi:hypothetical protein L0F63_003574 [Massospora cicadina]|nr:hypothetical protein L0F63_003574 [Massospora cicadina]
MGVGTRFDVTRLTPFSMKRALETSDRGSGASSQGSQLEGFDAMPSKVQKLDRSHFKGRRLDTVEAETAECFVEGGSLGAGGSDFVEAHNMYEYPGEAIEALWGETEDPTVCALKALLCSLRCADPARTQQLVACLRDTYALVPVENRNFTRVLSSLFKLLDVAPTDASRVALVRTINRLCHFPEVNPSHALALCLKKLKAMPTVACKKALYSAIYDILATKLWPNLGAVERILALGWEDLKSSCHVLRCSSVNLFGLLATQLAGGAAGLSANDVQGLLTNFGGDPDPRVRREAILAMTHLHLRGCVAKPSHYQLCVTGMKDEYEAVRLQSLDLLGLVCGTYPDEIIDVECDRVRLVDDAFTNVCNIINDPSPKVRSKADDKLLLQTFSKKAIAQKRNDAEPPSQQLNQGRVVQITADGEHEMAPDEVRLLKSGECGAFIHGLEDEFQEVRAASVGGHSIYELCMNSQEFSIKAVDFLVDAFNDEIDTVRMNSISSLAKICSAFPLTIDEEQLQIILSVLEDKKPSIRAGVHEVLSLLLLEDPAILPTLVNGLLVNLSRHPGDQPTIYGCLKLTGGRHSRFFDEEFIHKLFQVDKKFLTVEGNPEDPIYVAKAILVFNASLADPTLIKHFPAYLIKHLPYLKHKFPLHLAESSCEGLGSPKSILAPLAAPDPEKLAALLETSAEAVATLSFEESDLPRIQASHRTFVYLSANLTAKSGKAAFFATLLDALKVVIECRRKARQALDGLLLEGCRLLRISHQLEHQVLAYAYCCVAKLASEPKYFGLEIKPNRDRTASMIERVKSNARPSESAHLTRVLEALSKVDPMDWVDGANPKGFGDLVKAMDYPIGLPALPAIVKESKSILLSPVTNPHKPREMVPGLPLKLQLEGELAYVESVTSLLLQVCLPDGSAQYLRPPASSFTPQFPFHYKFSIATSLLLPATVLLPTPFSEVVRMGPNLPAPAYEPGPSRLHPFDTVALSDPLELFVQCRGP